MRIRNKLAKRLLIIGVVFAVLVGGAASAYLVRRSAIRAKLEKDRVEGLKAYAQGDNDRAAELLGTYISRTPDADPDAMIAYSRARALVPLPQGEHLRSAIFVLRKLLKDRPAGEFVEQRRELLDLYVKTQFWAEVKNTANLLLPEDAGPGPGDAPVWAARAKAAFALGDYDPGGVYTRKWLKLDPQNLEGQVLLLELGRRTKKYSDPKDRTDKTASPVELAERLIAAADASVPSTGPATRSAQREAHDAFLRGYALAMTPDANPETRRGNREKAIEQFRAARDLVFPDRRLTEIFIGLLDQLHMVDESIVVLGRLDKETGDPLVHARLAKRLWEQDDFKSVARVLSGLEIAKPATSAELMGIDAISEFQLGNKSRAEAIQKALEVRSSDPAKPDPSGAAWAAIVKSTLAPQSAEPARVAALCEKALSLDKSAYLAFLLGRLDAEEHDQDGALRNWQSAAQWSPTWGKPLTFSASLLSDSGKHQAAVFLAGEALLRSPHSVPTALAYISLLDTAVDAGVFPDPGKELEKVDREMAPALKGSGQLLCLRVNLLAAAGKSQDAAAEIRSAVASPQPPDERSLLRLLAISQKRKLGADVEKLCGDRIGHSFQLAAERAVKTIAAGDPVRALSAFDSERRQAADPQSVEWRFAWAQCLDRAGDPRAKDAIVQVADQETRDLNVQLFAGEARATAGDRPFLERVLARVKDLAGEGTAWRILGARNLLRFAPASNHPDVAKALELAQQALKDSPSSLPARLLSAEALERLGRSREALDQLKSAVAQYPDSPELALQYARGLERAGDHDAAHDQLARIRQLPDLSTQTRFGAAVLAVATGDRPLAQELVGDLNPADPRDLLIVAQINQINGKTEQAQTAFETLVRSPDPGPEALEAAAEFYFLRANADAVKPILDRLAADTRHTALSQYQLGRYAQRMRSGPALDHFQAAVTADPTFAPAWIELIDTQLKLGKTADAVANAKRAAAAVPADPHLTTLAKHADWLALWDSSVALRGLLSEFVRGRDADVPWLTSVITDHQSGIPVDELFKRTDKLISEVPDSLALYTYAFDLRMGAGRWDEAVDVASRMVRAFPSALEPRAAMVQVLRMQKKWSEVLTEAERWRERSAGNPVPSDLTVAEAYVELGRPREAVKQLAPYMDPRQPRELYDTVLPSYAVALNRVGGSDLHALMDPLLKTGPPGRSQYMSFVVSEFRDDPAQAVEWFDRASQAIPPGAVDEQIALAGAWAQSYHDSKAKPKDYLVRARAILQPLADATPPNVSALAALASFVEPLSVNDAIAAYRRVIATAPGDSRLQIFSRNNLAMLLVNNGGDINEAADLAHSAVKIAPVAELQDTVALIEMKRKNYEAALPAAEEAVKLTPRKVQYRVRLAEVLVNLGKPDVARKTLKEMDEMKLNMNQESDDVKRQLEEVRKKVATGPTTTALNGLRSSP